MIVYTIDLCEKDRFKTNYNSNSNRLGSCNIEFIEYNNDNVSDILNEYKFVEDVYHKSTPEYRRVLLCYMTQHKHGGLYVKCNCTIQDPLSLTTMIQTRSKHDPYYIMAVKSRTYRSTICLSAIYSHAGNKIWIDVLNSCVSTIESGKTGFELSLLPVTIGSRMLDKMLEAYHGNVDYVSWNRVFGNGRYVDKEIRRVDEYYSDWPLKSNLIVYIVLPIVIILAIVIMVLAYLSDRRTVNRMFDKLESGE